MTFVALPSNPSTRRWNVFLIGSACAALLGSCVAGTKPVDGQGWSRTEQLNWYHGNQGSRLIPKQWLMALEEAGSNKPFFTIANMQGLGYLAPDPDDTTGLPIGFAIDSSDDTPFVRSKLHWRAGQSSSEPWVGMTCAACHTGQIETEDGISIRIDGGPGLGDFQSFIEALDASTRATLKDPAKFARFATAVLGPHAPGEEGDLRSALTAFMAWEDRIEALNNPAGPDRVTLRYGHGRLDAFGHIYNKVAALSGAEDQFPAPADAPVSYPFLWNITQHDRVQWNGIAPNKGLKLPSGQVFDLGALGRNAGEVIGVFADVAVTKAYPGLSGYKSSIDVTNLDAIENQISRLLPPKWPTSLGTLNDTKVAAGRTLFAAHCASCHAPLDRTDLKTPIVAVMTPIWGASRAVGTDPWMACNAFTFRARTGNLAGVPTSYVGGGEKFAQIADERQMLTTTVVGSLAGKKRQIAATFAKAMFGIPRKIEGAAGLVEPEFAQKSPEEREKICRANAADPLMAYKGRPLGGIWATAPYLHNGSVRSLYQLLLPPARRDKQFAVGSRIFDTREVGFRAGPGKPPFEFHVLDKADRPIPGNSNAGHDYGNGRFNDDQRMELIEYMKSL